MRASTAVVWVAILAAPALAACGGDGGERRERVSAAAREVASVVEALERALDSRDFQAVCRRIFSSQARAQAGGEDCAERLSRSARELREPRIRVRDISLRGDRAVVQVITEAADQAPAPDTIVLVKEDGRYRVAALGAGD